MDTYTTLSQILTPPPPCAKPNNPTSPASSSGALPLNITLTPCAGYTVAYTRACSTTANLCCPIAEPTLFDISHCPIFKFVPVFVSNQEFVVLDFASLPKVDAVQKRNSVEKQQTGRFEKRTVKKERNNETHLKDIEVVPSQATRRLAVIGLSLLRLYPARMLLAR